MSDGAEELIRALRETHDALLAVERQHHETRVELARLRAAHEATQRDLARLERRVGEPRPLTTTTTETRDTALRWSGAVALLAVLVTLLVKALGGALVGEAPVADDDHALVEEGDAVAPGEGFVYPRR